MVLRGGQQIGCAFAQPSQPRASIPVRRVRPELCRGSSRIAFLVGALVVSVRPAAGGERLAGGNFTQNAANLQPIVRLLRSAEEYLGDSVLARRPPCRKPPSHPAHGPRARRAGRVPAPVCPPAPVGSCRAMAATATDRSWAIAASRAED